MNDCAEGNEEYRKRNPNATGESNINDNYGNNNIPKVVEKGTKNQKEKKERNDANRVGKKGDANAKYNGGEQVNAKSKKLNSKLFIVI